MTSVNTPIRRLDYRPPAHRVETIDLTFRLAPGATVVIARMMVVRNPANPYRGPLMLDGDEAMELLGVSIDGRKVDPEDWFRAEGRLNLGDIGERAEIEITTRIVPDQNTELEGLFISRGIFCTQCEPEGFRRITFYPDRPDVLARFRVRIEGDKQQQPVLLAGGNPVEAGDLPDGRHYYVFEDPYPKPAYLFAIVAGDLDWIEQPYTTISGRQIWLRIYVNRGNAGKARHAMESLVAAVAWDERVYGREYHLDVFNIVAVDDFVMAGMENTGLNLFNAAAVLADAETATDQNFAHITDVIGHEYFHNWTGNLVTVRDWFQLSLKEGFTVLREMEFSGAMNGEDVTRIQNVERLKRLQFSEDAGPTAHPIRLESYQAISNFYTPTVYEKGAEVVRMQAILLGRETFRQACDLYFICHAGQAVTCEDFMAAMEEVSGRDLQQFRRWYSQAGTPVVTAEGVHDAAAQTYTLRLSQTTPPTPGQPDKKPLHLPFELGLLDEGGHDLPLTLAGESRPGPTSRVLELREAAQDFVFTNIAEKPVASLLRGFTAPVKLEFRQSEDDLRFLMQHDSDGFNRGMAAKALAVRSLKAVLAGGSLSPAYLDAVQAILADTALDPAFAAEMLALPLKVVLAQDFPVIEVEGLTAAYNQARQDLAARLAAEWQRVYRENAGAQPYAHSRIEIGKRSLKNLALSYLTLDEAGLDLAETQYRTADNMTDRLAALALLVRDGAARGEAALADFYQRYQHDTLVVDKWFAVQAAADLPDRVEVVKRLTQHPDFTFTNPNRIYALIRNFAGPVSLSYHAPDGAGYVFLREVVERLNEVNTQMAAFMVAPLLQWRRYDAGRQALMRAELEVLLKNPGLSKNVAEQVGKSLDG
jgi:aminopeptidase N